MKVLIVDDDPEVVEFLELVATEFGCESTDTASSGEDAIGKTILAPYDLISLDVKMSGVDGLDALSLIRGLNAHTVIAIVTAYVDALEDDDIDTADVVLPKPVSLDAFKSLLALTAEIVDRRNRIRELGVNS